MKKLYTLLSVIFFATITAANPVITATVNHGDWNKKSTWDLNRKPKNGDTVLIPAGITVEIKNTISLGNATLYIIVNGSLELDGGKLRLGQNSVILVVNGASITAHGNSSEEIKIGNTIKYKGDHGMVAGPAIAHSTTGTSPNGFVSTGNGSLPVTFIGFNVAMDGKSALIDWSTAQEMNSHFFEVQSSPDGSSWTTIATVMAAGNSSEVKKYRYTDRPAAGARVYYRIRQVDLDGKFIYTAVRSITITEKDGQLKISSGMNHHIYLHFSSAQKGKVLVKVFNLSGQEMASTVLSNPVGQQIIPVNHNLKGICIVAVTQPDGVQKTGKILL